MAKRARKGFTIVEMLAVVGVIAVLLTIIVTAVEGSLKAARSKRADVMRRSLEQAIAAYYAQNGKWPDKIEKKVDDNSDEDVFEFRDAEADDIFREVVKNDGKSRLIDASALFVCDDATANSDKAHGYEFSEVSGKNAKHRISIDQMAFGYQDPASRTGYFRRFYVTYNRHTDAASVGPEFK